VAKKLIDLIDSGSVAVGEALPPTRALASQFGVSLNTVQVALRELETLRMIDCSPRQRSVVKSASPIVEQPVRAETRQVAIIAAVPADRVMQNSHAPWTSQIIHAMEQALFEAGYAAGLVSVPLEEVSEATIAARLDMFGSSLVGALCFPNPILPPFTDELERRGLPWIALNRPSPDYNHNFVMADHHKAGRRVGRIFVECGFERVVLLGRDMTGSSDLEKTVGFFQGYLESGASPQGIMPIACGGTEEADSYYVVQELLKGERPRPQAIFATGDYLAMGAIRAIQEAGLRVPDDISVLGATGLPASRIFRPPLSVVVQPTMEIGRNAAQLLHEMIDEGIFKCNPRRIPCRLILRESVKLPEALRRRLALSDDGEGTLESPNDETSSETNLLAAEAASF
jgi:LacI family transcriptional regulator